MNLNEEHVKNLLCVAIEMSSLIHQLSEGDDTSFDSLTDQAKAEVANCTHNDRLILLEELLPLTIEQLEVTLNLVSEERGIVEKY
jgi:hypothetical protein